MELFGTTTIIRKIILKGGLVAIDDGSRSGSGAIVGDNDPSLTIFETISHYDYDHTGCTDFSPDFATSSECSVCKCQDCKAKHDGVINAINALTSSVKEIASKRGVISSKRISYPYTPLEIKVTKRKRKDTSKASSSIEKNKIAMPLSLSYTDVQCAKAIGEQHEPKKGNVHHLFQQTNRNISILTDDTSTEIEATAEEHNITVDNLLTTSKEEEKVEPVSSGEQKNYPFEGFNISDEAPKKLTQLINDYLEWIADGLLKHHTGRYCLQQPNVSQNEECLINIIKGFTITSGLPWYLVDEVYIPINYGDEFHWVLVVVVLKEKLIWVYDSILRRRRFGLSSEIQKLANILPTYLDISGFFDQKVHTDWSMIEAYRDKMGNLFDIQYVEGIAQQTIGILDCDLYIAAYAEYLSDGLQVPNDGLDAGLIHKRYAAILWKYGEVNSQKQYASDIKDPR
ncbi:hypothetical protein T459_19643 [Capsicum annuum]|uniref:Ubiquitin-like protease family profile domain-containing protein n=1 Tax=Capsicum annuum TaxID=4072 RepID=A0A2G2Z2J2_CAPAN|nr:hypothetical protein T459_19643 [Capsicum annuum]